MKRFFLYLAAFFGCVLTGQAQMKFEPEMLVFSLNHGQSQASEVRIRNMGNERKEIEAGLSYRLGEKSSGNLDAWCSVQPKNFVLAPGGSQLVHLEFKGTATTPGECVLSLFAGEKLATPIPLNVRVGMPIFIRFNGEKRARGEILGLQPVWSTGNSLAVQVQVKNQGVLHLAPFGLAWVEDARQQRVWQADIRCEQPVFPGEVLTLGTSATAAAWQGAGELHVQMFWGTLYGDAAVGVPTSSAKQVPLPAVRLN